MNTIKKYRSKRFMVRLFCDCGGEMKRDLDAKRRYTHKCFDCGYKEYMKGTIYPYPEYSEESNPNWIKNEASKWIRVEDKLPEIDMDNSYLTFPHYRVLNFQNGNFVEWDSFADKYKKVDVTHWQPLLKPPKREPKKRGGCDLPH